MVSKPPLHPDELGSSLDVSTYRLPRWDAQGNLIDDSPKPIATVTEDVDDVELQPPSAEEIRQIHDAAYNEGFESGYQQGMKQGQQEGQKAGHQEGYAAGEEIGRGVGEQAGYDAALKTEQARIAEAVAPLQDVLAQLQGLLPKQEAELREGLVALAVRLARNLFDAELALKPEHIQALVHNAVQALPNADERLTIELHPDDLALVETMADSHWTLQAEPALSRGGCRVRSRFSYIDYSLEHRFRQQVSNLLAQTGLSERLEQLSQPWPLPAANESSDEIPLQAEHNPGEVVSESGVNTAAETTAEAPTSEAESAEKVEAATETPVTDSVEAAAPDADSTDSTVTNPDPNPDPDPDPDANTHEPQ